MELRQLQTFQVAAKHLSFSQAAAELHYAQSSVSDQIQKLEKRLGVSLFERLPRGICLTAKGQQLLEYSHKIFDLIDEAWCTISDTKALTDTLHVGIPETLCVYRLPQILQVFHQQCPEVRVVAHMTSGDTWRKRLQEGAVDAVIEYNLTAQISDFGATSLTREQVSLIAHPEHHLSQAPSVTPEDLHNELLLLTEHCIYGPMLEQHLYAEGVYPKHTLEFHSAEAIKQCVMAKMGIGFLPDATTAADIARGNLARLAWEGPPFKLYIYLIWRKNKWISPALQAFFDVTRAHIDDG